MALSIGARLPSFVGATEWLYNDEPGPDDFTGRPVLVHFWAVSCPACKMNCGEVQALQARYEPHGLRVVAVHLPRGKGDLDADLVRAVAEELGMTEPCAVDSGGVLGNRFETSGLWPVYFLFGPDGGMKRRGVGGAGLRLADAALARLYPDAT